MNFSLVVNRTDKLAGYRHTTALILRRPAVQIYFTLFALTALFLVTRQIPISRDDLLYIDYFGPVVLSDLDFSSVLVLVEEPLWTTYCALLSSVASPEMSIRLTIFVSLVVLALVPLVLGCRGLIFYWAWFAFHPHLATEITFNQIRQGFALAVFMGLFALSRKVVVPAFIASLFHTSVASMWILAISRRHVVAAGIPVVLVVLLTVFSEQLSFLLGRRAFYLDEPIQLTLNFYVVNVALLLFFGVILFRYQRHQLGTNSLVPTLFWGWIYFSVCVLVISVYLYFGPRLEYFSAYLLGLLLAMCNERQDKRILYGRVCALLYLVVLDARLEYTHEANSPLSNWSLIFGLQ